MIEVEGAWRQTLLVPPSLSAACARDVELPPRVIVLGGQPLQNPGDRTAGRFTALLSRTALRARAQVYRSSECGGSSGRTLTPSCATCEADAYSRAREGNGGRGRRPDRSFSS